MFFRGIVAIVVTHGTNFIGLAFVPRPCFCSAAEGFLYTLFLSDLIVSP